MGVAGKLSIYHTLTQRHDSRNFKARKALERVSSKVGCCPVKFGGVGR